jgi:hypothetical protein
MSVQRALDVVRDAAQRTLKPPSAGITTTHDEKARR